MLQSGLSDEWWDCAMEGYCYLHNVHDKMADGKAAWDKNMRRDLRWTFDRVRSSSRLQAHLFEGRGKAASIWHERCFRRTAWDLYYVQKEDGQATCSWRIAKTARTCQPSRTRRKAVGSMCRRISLTLRSSSTATQRNARQRKP